MLNSYVYHLSQYFPSASLTSFRCCLHDNKKKVKESHFLNEILLVQMKAKNTHELLRTITIQFFVPDHVRSKYLNDTTEIDLNQGLEASSNRAGGFHVLFPYNRANLHLKILEETRSQRVGQHYHRFFGYFCRQEQSMISQTENLILLVLSASLFL